MSKFFKALKSVAKVASPFIAPIAAASGVGLPLAAALGAGTGLLSGGGLKGALIGGASGALGAGGGGVLGNYLNSAGNLGLSSAASSALGGAIGGAGVGGLSGGGLKGALLSGAAGGIGGYIQGSGGIGNAWDNLTGSGTDAISGAASPVFKTAGELSGNGAGISSNGLTGVDNAGYGVTAGGGSSVFANSADKLKDGLTGLTGVADSAASPGLQTATNAATDSGNWFTDLFKNGDAASSAADAATPGKTNYANLTGNILSSVNSSVAQDQAKNELLDSQTQAMEQLSPYLQGGKASNARLQELLGIGGDPNSEGYGSLGEKFDSSNLQDDPGYKFALEQGTNALNSSLGAQGKLFSGDAITEGQKFTTGLANQTYNDAYNRWLTGQNAIYQRYANTSNSGQQAAAGAADLDTTGGSTRANSTIAQSNIINSTLSSILGGSGSRQIIGYDPVTRNPIYADDKTQSTYKLTAV